MEPLSILVWTFIFVVITTAVITFLALLGMVRLGGGDGSQHDYYLRKLFEALIIEVLVVAVGAFSVNLTNRNEQFAGLKDLARKTNSNDSISLPKDTLSIATKSDSSLKPKSPAIIKKITGIDSVNQVAKKIVIDTLKASIYATTDNPSTDVQLIAVPSGSHYLGHNTILTTKNGDAIYNVELVTSGNNVEAVKITASVEPRSLFGPRNWIGVVLQVYIEKQIE